MAQPTDSTSTMIKLDDSQWDQFVAQSDRTQPSPYQGDINTAQVGEKFAVPLPIEKNDKGEDVATGDRAIVNNLHKAARTAGKNIQVMVRRNTTPPAVLWRILDGEYVAPSRGKKTDETVAAPAATEGTSPAV